MRAAAILLLFLALEAGAVEVDGQGRIVLSPAEIRACNAEGGCVILTRKTIDQVRDMLRDAETRLNNAAKCGAQWKRTTTWTPR